MISVDDALRLIDDVKPDWGTDFVSVTQASRKTLAQDIIAPFNHPRFKTSMMDGYALRKVDILGSMTVVEESRAGQPYSGTLGPQQAVRIYTGPIIPGGADYVEIQEHAIRKGELLKFSCVSQNKNFIRPQGADFQVGDCLFKKGAFLKPAHIFALATANVSKVKVERIPTVALLRSGDELKPVGTNLENGDIVDSIGPALISLFSE